MLSEKLDVYAYGVTLWEILSRGKDPYPKLVSTRKKVSAEELSRQLIAMRPDVRRLPDCPESLRVAMIECWFVVRVTDQCWTDAFGLRAHALLRDCAIVGC